jgi:hypothetical protein
VVVGEKDMISTLHQTSSFRQTCLIARHRDPAGRLREVLVCSGAAGSTLVIDRDCATHDDLRLIAHLAADEPRVNALFACRDFLRNSRRLCRPLTVRDLAAAPLLGDEQATARAEHRLCDRHGFVYRLAVVRLKTAMPVLRWQRQRPCKDPRDERNTAPRSEHVLVEQSPPAGVRATATGEDAETVCVREAIGAFESYRPIRQLTAVAINRCAGRDDISTARLRAELQRVDSSQIVLNRGLREAVLVAVNEWGLTMSEITVRCGRCKRDARGHRHGDTSWLARRVGLVPERGRKRPTPWVHSDVLALIAREGLGISPHEVELG